MMEGESELNSSHLPITVASTGCRKGSPSWKGIIQIRVPLGTCTASSFSERRTLSPALRSIPTSLTEKDALSYTCVCWQGRHSAILVIRKLRWKLQRHLCFFCCCLAKTLWQYQLKGEGVCWAHSSGYSRSWQGSNWQEPEGPGSIVPSSRSRSPGMHVDCSAPFLLSVFRIYVRERTAGLPLRWVSPLSP